MNAKDDGGKMTAKHVCPWWLAYTFDNPLRRLLDPPHKSLEGVVKKGMTILDVGCGFGHYSIGAARLVGAQGRVIAADLQEKMLQKTMARAQRCGLSDRITPWQCQSSKIGYIGKVDVVIAGNVVHEVPDAEAFFKEAFEMMKAGGLLLVIEPGLHVSSKKFNHEVQLALNHGFEQAKLSVSFSYHRTLLKRPMEPTGL